MLDSTEPWVLGKFPDRSTTEGGRTLRSQACFADHGFLLRERILEGSSPGANDVIRQYNRDTAGNRIEERYYGGDVQSVSTGSNLCDLSLPSAQYRLQHTYDYGVRETTRYFDGSDPLQFYASWVTVDL